MNSQESQLIESFVESSEKDFENIFVDYYFCGSRLDDSSNQNSDLDLILVVDKDVDIEIQKAFGDFLNDFNTYPIIETCTFDLRDLETLPAWAKNAKHIHGVDSFQNIPLESIEQSRHRFIHGVYRFLYIFLRDSAEQLQYPLPLPDKNSEFYGYTIQQTDFGFSLKRFVSATARICGALLALHHDYQAVSKKDSILQYAEKSEDGFSEFVLHCYSTISKKWDYNLPTDRSDLTKLHLLLRDFNLFENYFLVQVSQYMQSQRDLKLQDSWFIKCEEMIKLS
ncbi:MAG: hypothetical protein KC646_01015 [Candidatus Cloacimonetes bacterium]|nr:hypothetical protein [Candidatus Cloacimonadota bacterium]